MRIHTKIVLDMATGAIEHEEGFEYHGPIALCDRSVQSGAGQVATGDKGTAGTFGSQAGSMFNAVGPTISRWAAGETPGYGSLGLGQMLTSAEATAGAARSAGDEQARLRAMRTGNMASIAPTEAGIAGETGRGLGLAVQNILAKNAMLKEAQQEKGLGLGAGLYGTGGKLQEGALGLSNEALQTQLKAGQAGWLQNLMGLMQAGGGGAGSAMAGYGAIS